MFIWETTIIDYGLYEKLELLNCIQIAAMTYIQTFFKNNVFIVE